MHIHSYRLGPLDNNTYLVVDEVSRAAAIVDPSFGSEALWPEIEAAGWRIALILNTHAHFDHVVGNAFYVERTDAPLALHRADLEILRGAPSFGRMFGLDVPPSPEPTLFLEEGRSLALGETRIDVIHTPGHAPGHVTFLVEGFALAGDCLFAGSIGRTDIPAASPEMLQHTLRTRLLTLPDETVVLPGHGEQTTIGRERATNPFLGS